MRHGDQIYIGDSVLIFLLKQDGEHLDKKSGRVPGDRRYRWLSASASRRGLALPAAGEDRSPACLPTARRARDLNSLLKIATGIGGIRDQDSLQWQLLGFIFEVVPGRARRGSALRSSGRVHFHRCLGPGARARPSGSGQPHRGAAGFERTHRPGGERCHGK